ncbi:MAG: hypothetical protein ACPGLY_10790 [Rubripirellula sp.]
MTHPRKVGFATPAAENSISDPAWCFRSGDQEWAGLEEEPAAIAIERVLPPWFYLQTESLERFFRWLWKYRQRPSSLLMAKPVSLPYVTAMAPAVGLR